MVFTSGNVAANFFRSLALASSFIIGWFNYSYVWLLLAALFVVGAYWTRKYKATGQPVTNVVDFLIAIVVCLAFFGAGRYASIVAAG